MELSGQRVQLSLLDESDFALFVEISMSKEMMEHVCDPLTYDEAKAAFHSKSKPWTIESESWLTFGISDVETGEKLGSIGLKVTNHESKVAAVGFMIKKNSQGKGYGYESLSLVKDYAFNYLGLNKIAAICSTNNTGSYKLLEKSGLLREGCLKQNSMVANKLVDDYVYGLCRSEL